MIGCLRTRVGTQPIIVLYFESETVLKFYNLEARILQKITEFDTTNWTAVHNLLNTGPLWDRHGAGSCTELETARIFVRDQLTKFESLTFPSVRMG